MDTLTYFDFDARISFFHQIHGEIAPDYLFDDGMIHARSHQNGSQSQRAALFFAQKSASFFLYKPGD